MRNSSYFLFPFPCIDLNKSLGQLLASLFDDLGICGRRLRRGRERQLHLGHIGAVVVATGPLRQRRAELGCQAAMSEQNLLGAAELKTKNKNGTDRMDWVLPNKTCNITRLRQV